MVAVLLTLQQKLLTKYICVVENKSYKQSGSHCYYCYLQHLQYLMPRAFFRLFLGFSSILYRNINIQGGEIMDDETDIYEMFLQLMKKVKTGNSQRQKTREVLKWKKDNQENLCGKNSQKSL